MKILLITDEIWNDSIFGNNVLQNWFEGMENVEIAQIGCLPNKPYNKVCFKYFQLTDVMMAKSLFGKRAGVTFETTKEEMENNKSSINYIQASPFYSFLKKISGPSMRALREILWNVGRLDKNELKKFITGFNPDVVFCPRFLNWKLMRIEKIVKKYTNAPFIAFTADDEESFNQINFSPVYWVNRFLFRCAFKKHIKLYRHYFTFSQDQSNRYNSLYGIESSTLYKSGQFEPINKEKEISSPIRMIYAGRLYCNRWKSLAEIGKVLRDINKDSTKIFLDIYTQDKLTKKQKKVLSSERFVNIKGSLSPSELKDEYQKADIALHVESLDPINKRKTKLSFSTKIIDLMDSNCAIMAICWNEHTGYKYLKENNAAICIDDYKDIPLILNEMVKNPQLIKDYMENAYECGVKNHTKEKIQKQLFDAFSRAIAEK